MGLAARLYRHAVESGKMQPHAQVGSVTKSQASPCQLSAVGAPQGQMASTPQVHVCFHRFHHLENITASMADLCIAGRQVH
jgi:hypothetical protein